MNLWTRRKPKRLVKTKKRRPSLSRLLLLDTSSSVYLFSLRLEWKQIPTIYEWEYTMYYVWWEKKCTVTYLYLHHVFQNPAVMIEKKFDKSGKSFFYNQTIVLHIFLTLMLSWLAHGQTKYNVFGYVHNLTSRWCF